MSPTERPGGSHLSKLDPCRLLPALRDPPFAFPPVIRTSQETAFAAGVELEDENQSYDV